MKVKTRILNRSKKMLVVTLVVALVLALQMHTKTSIKIGVLQSLTGTMAISEAPLVDAVRLAVEEENWSDRANEQKIEMIVADCRSDDAYCAQQAEKLITQEGVQALFGCWTSSCRKAVQPVVEKHNIMLFYPVQYEGLEQSPNIIYTGAAPNQQIIPMVLWALQHKGKRFYMIGSNYIFPRTANRMVKDILLTQGAQLIGERYIPLGASDVSLAVKEIAEQHPDFVFNTLNGDTNLHFFRALHNAGIDADKTPVFSTSIAENEVLAIGTDLMVGHYATWNYFQSLDTVENKGFVVRFKQRFGKGRVLDDPMEASYIGAKLWMSAIRGQDITDLASMRTALGHEAILAPDGIVAVDYNSMHLWKNVYIAKVRADGQFDIVWHSPKLVHPAPFPFYHSRAEWQDVQKALRGAKQ